MDDFLFAAAGDVRRRHESYFHVFLGAGYQMPAATQVELVFNVLAMAWAAFCHPGGANVKPGISPGLLTAEKLLSADSLGPDLHRFPSIRKRGN
jgi:hypothetical protein